MCNFSIIFFWGRKLVQGRDEILSTFSRKVLGVQNFTATARLLVVAPACHHCLEGYPGLEMFFKISDLDVFFSCSF